MRNMKKTILLLLLLVPLFAQAQSYHDGHPVPWLIDGVYYNFFRETSLGGKYYYYDGIGPTDNKNNKVYAEVTYGPEERGGWYEGRVNIPATVTHNGWEFLVTSIDEKAFYDCHDLSSVIIPNSITSIGDHAFESCDALTSIEIPNSVKTIGNRAFSSTSLTSVSIPNSVVTIGDYAFYFCGLKTVTIGNSVKTIGEGAFQACSFESISIPNSVTTIGEIAFRFCSDLSTLTIGKNATSIAGTAFIHCPKLKSIIVASDNTKYNSNGGCNAIIETASKVLIQGCQNTIIPNTVTSIGDNAFEGQGISSITIPNSVTSIGKYAFRDGELTSITIPNSVTTIGDEAFRSCGRLTSVSIPKSIKSLGANVFGDCTNVKDLIYEDGCTTALKTGLTSVTSVSLPNTITSIGNNAFESCTKLSSITIPNSCKSIGKNAFMSCSNLSSISIPNSTSSIGSQAFRSCKNLKKVTFGNSVKSIGNYAFYGCDGLTTVTFPNSLTSIGNRAFYWCSGLSSVKFSNSLSSIGEEAFYFCKGLSSISLSNSLKFIGEKAFAFCSNLTAVTLGGSPDCEIKDNAFYACDNITELVYADGATSTVKTGLKQITSVRIPITVKSIGDESFWGCSKLTSVIIPNSVTKIGYNAFSNCLNLTSVVIPNLVTNIGEGAFKGCSKLSSVTIGKSTIGIGHEAFSECKNLTSVTSYSSTPPIITSKSFTKYDTLHVLPSCVNVYKSREHWNNFNIIGDAELNEILVSSINLAPQSLDIFVGDTKQLSVTISPDNSTNKSVSWSSSNPDIATVNSEGLITAMSPGTVQISCVANDGSGISATCSVTVKKQSTTFNVTITSAGYATFYSSETAYILPKGLSAQIVTDYVSNKLTYKTIANGSSDGVIPVGTAVMLVSDTKGAGTFTLVSSESTETYSGINYLHGSDDATTTSTVGNNSYYKLSYGEANFGNVVGWYWGASNGAAFSIDAHKAWLALPSTTIALSPIIPINTSGIEDLIQTDDHHSVYYDLQGHRLTGKPSSPGIYIYNGIKVLITK